MCDTGLHNGTGDTVMSGDTVVTTGAKRMFTVTGETANQAGSKVALWEACLRLGLAATGDVRGGWGAAEKAA